MLSYLFVAIVGPVLVAVGNHQADHRSSQARVDMSAISDASRLYKVNTGEWPQTLDDLLVDNHNLGRRWKGPYLAGSPLDPWEGAYVYYPPSTHGDPYLILSYGADRRPGGEAGTEDEDISSWEVLSYDQGLWPR